MNEGSMESIKIRSESNDVPLGLICSKEIQRFTPLYSTVSVLFNRMYALLYVARGRMALCCL